VQDIIDLVSHDDFYWTEREKATKLRLEMTAVGNAGSFGMSYFGSSSQDGNTYSMP
jgi:hypothetical protein